MAAEPWKLCGVGNEREGCMGRSPAPSILQSDAVLGVSAAQLAQVLLDPTASPAPSAPTSS